MAKIKDKQLEERKLALKQQKLPDHIAVIMDGNGRWAKKRHFSRIRGHRAGIETVRNIVRVSNDLNIKYLTLYTFSSENWNRPRMEVKGIMTLLAETIKKEVPELNKKGVRVKFIGDIDGLPEKSRRALLDAVDLTSENKGLTMVMALNYGGRDEIVRAMKSMAVKLQNGEISVDDINSDLITNSLDTAEFPDPDLLIRTSGEFRLSNFLLWQLAYTELWITDTLWPEFSPAHFLDAIESYAHRERRFGKTSQQITGEDTPIENASEEAR